MALSRDPPEEHQRQHTARDQLIFAGGGIFSQDWAQRRPERRLQPTGNRYQRGFNAQTLRSLLFMTFKSSLLF
jgi:hypothetical protein